MKLIISLYLVYISVSGIALQYETNNLFYLLVFILSGFGIKPQNVYVSFKNSSAEDFNTLHVKIFGKDYFFENLRSGKTTKPINIEKTYRYCFAEVITSKDTLVFQPIDYVGETLYRGGKVTMDFYIFPKKARKEDCGFDKLLKACLH